MVAVEILGAKFSKCNHYESEPGKMSRRKCTKSNTSNKKNRCPCVIRILIKEIDEDLNEILDDRFIKH